MVDFKGVHFPKEAILYAVFFYLRYPGSYRDLEEIMEERGVDVDHGTLNRWVVKFAPLMAAQAQSRKKPTAESWRMDETYIKVKGKWTYYYRAVDNTGKTGLVARTLSDLLEIGFPDRLDTADAA